jgi:small subunit ribosomal protein S8
MYYNLISQLKNAAMAKKDTITVPYSKMDLAVLRALTAAGYIKSAEKEMVGRKAFISIRIAMKAGQPVMTDFRLMSKPSRRTYIDYRSIRAVKQGHGVSVLSTSKGIMTNKEARKAKLGGEYLFEIW